MIVDTSVLLAYFNTADPAHEAATTVIETTTELRVVSPYVVAELDYFVATRSGVDAELAVMAELSNGSWDLPAFGPPDIEQAAGIIAKYRDQNIGIADASNVVLADRYSTRTIATLDRRHFDVVRPIKGGKFTVLPR